MIAHMNKQRLLLTTYFFLLLDSFKLFCSSINEFLKIAKSLNSDIYMNEMKYSAVCWPYFKNI